MTAIGAVHRTYGHCESREWQLSVCEYCSKSYLSKKITRGRFCSQDCYRKHNRGRHSICPQCGAEYRNRRNTKHCSRACSNIARTGISYRRGQPHSETAKLKHQKEFIINRDGEKCSICGLPPTWNDAPLTLQVDHIDGDHKNNEWGNLRMVCPNCHTQTETYGGKNVKYRETFRKRV